MVRVVEKTDWAKSRATGSPYIVRRRPTLDIKCEIMTINCLLIVEQLKDLRLRQMFTFQYVYTVESQAELF